MILSHEETQVRVQENVWEVCSTDLKHLKGNWDGGCAPQNAIIVNFLAPNVQDAFGQSWDPTLDGALSYALWFWSCECQNVNNCLTWTWSKLPQNTITHFSGDLGTTSSAWG